jgi:hypothetical protein
MAQFIRGAAEDHLDTHGRQKIQKAATSRTHTAEDFESPGVSKSRTIRLLNKM